MFVYELKTELLVCQIKVKHYILWLKIEILRSKNFSNTKTTKKLVKICQNVWNPHSSVSNFDFLKF